MDYPVESFTEAERARLRPHFTNLDRPVFALVNLPGDGQGRAVRAVLALPGHAAAAVPRRVRRRPAGATAAAAWDGEEGGRAAQLYERIFLGYGDDSVAQLGGAHVACEWVSNVLTKILQRPRLGAYLEQSTRYIAYDAPMPDPPGGYRYYRDAELGPEYAAAMDELFSIYSAALPRRLRLGGAGVSRARTARPRRPHARAIKAKALDLLRGLLPASSLSHMGIFATGQTYEQLILHLLAHPLPEARATATMILEEIKAVMPSFVARVERPDRGGEWIGYLDSRARGRRALGRAPADIDEQPTDRPSVRLLRAEGDEDDLLARAAVRGQRSLGGADPRRRRARSTPRPERELLAELVGERRNRRHRPGRGFEALRYRFEIVSDYGAFRDLQRHRMLTVQWQALTPDLGAGVPEQVELAGCGDEYRRALELSRREYERLVDRGLAAAAPYALCLGYRIRYVLDLNAREAMQLIELRSGREGHPSYRAVAHEMHAQIASVHPAVAAAMTPRRHRDRAAARADPVRDAQPGPRRRRILIRGRGGKDRRPTGVLGGMPPSTKLR